MEKQLTVAQTEALEKTLNDRMGLQVGSLRWSKEEERYESCEVLETRTGYWMSHFIERYKVSAFCCLSTGLSRFSPGCLLTISYVISQFNVSPESRRAQTMLFYDGQSGEWVTKEEIRSLS